MAYIITIHGLSLSLSLWHKKAYPTGSMVSLNTGKNAIVLRQNADNPTRPIVRIVEQNKNGEWIRKEDKDLAEELALFIVDTIEE